MNLRAVAAFAVLVMGLPLHTAAQNMGVIAFENSGAPGRAGGFPQGPRRAPQLPVSDGCGESIPARAGRRSGFRARVLGRGDVVRPRGLARAGSRSRRGPRSPSSVRRPKRVRRKQRRRARRHISMRWRSCSAKATRTIATGATRSRWNSCTRSIPTTSMRPASTRSLCWARRTSGRDVPTYMRAAALMEEMFERNPQHPGAAHYLIHAVDDSVHAPLGLRAAECLREDRAGLAARPAHDLAYLPGARHVGRDGCRERADHSADQRWHACAHQDAPLLGCGHRGHVARHTRTCSRVDSPMRAALTRRLRRRDAASIPSMPEHEMGPQSALDSDSSSAASFSRDALAIPDRRGRLVRTGRRDESEHVENVITAEFTRDWADAYGAVRFGKLDAADRQRSQRAKDSTKTICRCGDAPRALRRTHRRMRMPKIEQQQLDGLLLLKQRPRRIKASRCCRRRRQASARVRWSSVRHRSTSRRTSCSAKCCSNTAARRKRARRSKQRRCSHRAAGIR